MGGIEADIQSGDAIEFRTESAGNKGQVTDSLFINGKYTEHGSKGQLAGIPSFHQACAGQSGLSDIKGCLAERSWKLHIITSLIVR